MLRYVWKLLRSRWRITFNNIWRASRRRKIGLFFAAFGILAFAAFLVFISWGMLSILRRPELAGYVTPELLRAVPVLFTSVTVFGGLLTNFGVLLQSLYLAGDMEFLLAAPIPPRAVFVTKLIQAVLPNFLLVSLFNLPALVGLGLAQDYNVTYFVMLPITLVLLMLFGAGVSAVGVMAIVRVVPARRVAEVLGLVGGITSILCSQSGQLSRVSGLGRSAVPSTAQMMLWTNRATQVDVPFSPLAWPGRMLVALGEGQWLAALLFGGLTAAMTLGVFMAALSAAERLYISGWAQTRVAAMPHRAPRAERRQQSGLLLLLPRPFIAIIAKDFKLLRRDLRNLSQLVTPLIFGVIYTVSLVRGTERASGPMEQTIIAYGGLGTALFVSWMFAARLALGGIGMEGKRYWLIKIAPMRPETLLLAKFSVAYLPALALGGIFLVASTVLGRSAVGALAYNAVAFAAAIAALCAVYLAFGTAGANLNWEDPRQITRGLMGCTGWIAGTLSVGLVAGIFVGVPVIFAILEWPEVAGQLLGLVIGFIVCIVIVGAALLWARKRVVLVGE